MEVVQLTLDGGTDGRELCEGLAVEVGQRTESGNLPVEVLRGEDESTVHEVTEDSYQLIVVACLEVTPREVVVLRLGGIGREDVAQDVLLTGQILEVLIEPDGPVAARGDLVALEIEELIGGDVLGEDVGAFGTEHRREDDAVEDDVVLADEVQEARVFALPPLLPAVGQEFLRIGDIADGRIEPHVEHLALGTLYGYGDAPVEVTAHSTGLQASVEPALTLPVDIALPLLVVLEDPLLEEGLVLVKGQIPVLCLAELRRSAGDSALGVDEVGGVQRRATGLTLVTIGALILTARAGTRDVAVREELLGLGVVVLLALFFDEAALIVDGSEDRRGKLTVRGARRTAVDIEGDTEVSE